MATKNTTFTLSQNQTSSEVTSHATVSGRTVYGKIVSATETIKQSAYVQTSNIWIKPGTSSVIVNCSRQRPTRLENFKVEINGTSSTALSCSYTGSSYPSGPVSATVPGVTGTTSYTISLQSWYPTSGTDWRDLYLTTEFTWKENGVTKRYTANTNSGITETFVVEADTELSDFAIRLAIGNDPNRAIIYFTQEVPLTVINKSALQTHIIGSINILFASPAGNYFYETGGRSMAPNGTVTLNPNVKPPERREMSSPINLYLQQAYITLTDDIYVVPDNGGILRMKDLSGNAIAIELSKDVSGTPYQLIYQGNYSLGTVALGDVSHYNPSYDSVSGMVIEIDSSEHVADIQLSGQSGNIPNSGTTVIVHASWSNLSSTGITFTAEPASAITSGPTPATVTSPNNQQDVQIVVKPNTGSTRTLTLHASGFSYNGAVIDRSLSATQNGGYNPNTTIQITSRFSDVSTRTQYMLKLGNQTLLTADSNNSAPSTFSTAVTKSENAYALTMDFTEAQLYSAMDKKYISVSGGLLSEDGVNFSSNSIFSHLGSLPQGKYTFYVKNANSDTLSLSIAIGNNSLP